MSLIGAIWGTVLAVVLQSQDGRTEQSRLTGEPGAYRLRVHRPAREDVERELSASDLASALAECPEITGLTAHEPPPRTDSR